MACGTNFPSCSFVFSQTEITRARRSESVSNPSSYCPRIFATSSSALTIIPAFSFGGVRSAMDQVMPEQVACSKPSFFISLRYSLDSSLLYLWIIFPTNSIISFLRSILLTNSKSFGKTPLKIIRPQEVSVFSPLILTNIVALISTSLFSWAISASSESEKYMPAPRASFFNLVM